MRKYTSSGRIYRRQTNNDVLDKKSKSRRLLGRKRNIRHGRPASFALSLSRFPTFSSCGSGEGLSDVSAVSDTASTRSVSSAQSSSALSLSVETMVSTTVIDIHDHVEESVKQKHNDHDSEEHNSNCCDDFWAKLLDLIQCFPRKVETGEKPRKRETYNDDFLNRIMRIECILEQADDEESDELDPTSSPLNHTQYLSRPTLSEWGQESLLLIATPGRSGMMVRRIRRVSDPSYFESSASTYSETMQGHIRQLPINNGKEHPLHSWVIDFETNLFAGTALFRVRGLKGWNSLQSIEPMKSDINSMASHDYFDKHNRKFQMVIRGNFKSNVIMADCMAGLLLDDHLAAFSPPNVNCADRIPIYSESGTNEKVDAKNKNKRLQILKRRKIPREDTLPPKWALRAAMKVAGVFSPRMDADLESPHPRILSPLCSTAQTISVSRKPYGGGDSNRLDETHVEPSPYDKASLINHLNISPTKKPVSTATDYVQQRKRLFDAAYDAHVQSLAKSPAQGNASPCFDPEAEYTFEFLQHLIDYNDLSLDLGKVLGKVRLGGALRGQPIRFVTGLVKQRNSKAATESHMSMDDLDYIWSFDLWHKSLVI